MFHPINSRGWQPTSSEAGGSDRDRLGPRDAGGKRATDSIPIVVLASTDPVATALSRASIGPAVTSRG